MSQSLLVERLKPGIVQLTLNRPEILNAIDMELAERLIEQFDRLASDADTSAIVITGAGKGFSAGFDIHEMSHFDADQMLAAFVKRDPLMWKVAACPKPVIAALHGVVYGAGALIAAAADLRIGGQSTTFRVTATRYGGANATWTLPHLVGVAKAKEILMTGRAVAAPEMREIGLLNDLVSDADVLETALGLAARIAENPPEGVAWVKRLINGGMGRSYQDQFQAENGAMSGELRPQGGGDVFARFLKPKTG